jgi:hypothetical protein
MTIPLDRLYHYIENIAQDIRGDTVVIYRFYPHGSKKIEDLNQLKPQNSLTYLTSPHMYCNDQEPLDYHYYQQANIMDHPDAGSKRIMRLCNIDVPNTNFRLMGNIFDKVLLLHSEQRSSNLELYRSSVFIPVYYWSHAIISLDWFRYAQHVSQIKQITKKFLIYSRAWSGTREYRLKFVDLLIKYNLHTDCLMSFNINEPESKIHYDHHKFKNTVWKPINKLEHYFDKNVVPSHASADFDLLDYEATDFEVVLETLFDDERLHLTEKTLRPIAVGQPFLLVAPYGCLAYLRQYGFKTFGSVIDESYDDIKDPVVRLETIVKLMKTINEWTVAQREQYQDQINQIVNYNRNYFFSNEFFYLVITELKDNLKAALTEQEDTNTGEIIERRKKLSKHPVLRDRFMGKGNTNLSKPDIIKFVKQARQYYLRNKH